MLASHNRFKYSALPSRAQFTWPEGKRLALYVATNIEHFPYGVQCGVDLDRQTQPWSQRSWLWREYGNRIGGFRLIELCDELQIPMAVIANTANYDHCPELIDAHRARGDELIAHGRSNAERQIEMRVEDERAMIREVTEQMTDKDGVRPGGWLSPYLTPSEHTTDLLVEAGYEYVLDWGICDEQPFWVNASPKPILSMPYPIELNDQPAVVYRHNTAAEYADMIIDNFDEMLKRSEASPLVMTVSLHSFIMGQPYRVKQLRRAFEHIMRHREDIWLTLPRDVAAYYKSLPIDQQLQP
ncbi:polysaccharide deacetylase [Parapusillimonas sp. JC17]|uniref:polysaccharide deacetylase n=1 Tax=Parapusillimonas sp. JC17 TaxID=3445768 RepID=UPI003FA15239